MRRIGTLSDTSQAQRFVQYLLTLSIEASYEDDSARQEAGQCEVWVRDEAEVERAREELRAFRQQPDADRYDVADRAAKLLKERQARDAERLKRQRKLQRKLGSAGGGGRFAGLGRQRTIPVTVGIIVISVIVGFATNMGRPIVSRDGGATLTTEAQIYFALSFVDPREQVATGDGFASVRRGQVWRFITPMFLHGDTFHLAFNMIMLFMLGSALERIHGSFYYLILVLVSQLAGMFVQVSLPDWLPPGLQGSFNVVGASGAVYGLFGFLWLRPRFDPGYPIHIPPASVVIMLGWLFFCMTPLVSGIANGAHLGGLLAGMAFAAAPQRWGGR